MEQRCKNRDPVASEEPRCVVHDVPDDLLRLILLRLDSPLSLVRAACACKRWRRVVTVDDADQGRTFLRLASSLHPPTIVGQFHNHTHGDHRFVPSSPPAAPIDRSRFAVDDFIVNKWHCGSHVVDCHGSLVLLRMVLGQGDLGSTPSLVVYDPLTRQHYAIYDRCPPLPKEFTGYSVRDTFLLDGDDGDISVSNFRVICRLSSNGALAGPQSCVFSTANGGKDWRFLSQPADAATDCLGQLAGRVDRCLYVGLQMGRVIALDNASLLFSKVQLPILPFRFATSSSGLFRPSTFTVVHGGAGGLGPTSPARMTTSILHVCGVELELFRQVHGSGEWVLEHSIPNLSEATRGLSTCPEKCRVVGWRTMLDAIADDGAGVAILSADACSGDVTRRRFFSIEVHTMEIRVLPEEPYRRLMTAGIFNYTLPWPHFLQACP